jgi:hypothetical protein
MKINVIKKKIFFQLIFVCLLAAASPFLARRPQPSSLSASGPFARPAVLRKRFAYDPVGGMGVVAGADQQQQFFWPRRVLQPPPL